MNASETRVRAYSARMQSADADSVYRPDTSWRRVTEFADTE